MEPQTAAGYAQLNPSSNYPTSAPIGAVNAAIESLSNASVDLRDVVNTLARRLECILRPAAMKNGLAGSGDEKPVPNSIAEKINQSTGSIFEEIKYIQELIDRLEI